MTQQTMFPAGQDLPLFSGTAQTAQRQDFNPPQAARQLDLLPRPEPWMDEPEPPPEPDPTNRPTCYICGELAQLDTNTDRPICESCDAVTEKR